MTSVKGSRQAMGLPGGDTGSTGQRAAGQTLSPHWSLQAELQQKVDENEHLRLELQMVEAERVRLSLLEEKLVDVLQLLQRLRDLVSSWELA